MKYAAVRALIIIAAGIALNATVSTPWWSALPFIVIGFIIMPWTKSISLYLSLAAAAFLYNSAQKPAPPHPQTYQITRFEGIVVQEPMGTNRATLLLLPPLYGKITLFLKDSFPLHYGDRIAITAKIRPLSLPRNPGMPDYNQILFNQGIVGSTSIARSGIKTLNRSSGNPLLTHIIMPARRYFFKTIHRQVGGKEAGLLLGLLLGEKSDLPEPVKNAFIDSGTLHLMAVSGIHVSIIVLVFWLLLSVFRIRGWWRFSIMSIATLFYILIAGWRASAVRAGVMAWAALLSTPLQRRSTPLTNLCLAGIVMLLLNPATLFNPGAQLSFAATLAIVVVTPRLEPLFKNQPLPHPLHHYLLSPILISLAATLGTAPLLLHHFFRFQPLAFLSNLFLVPLTTLALPLGLLVTVLNLIHPALASIPAESLRLLLKLIILIAHLFSNLKLAVIEPGKVPWFWVFYLYAMSLFSLHYHKYRRNQLFKIGLLAALALPVWLPLFHRTHSTVTFLDTGHGEATLLVDTLGRKLLIDAAIDKTDILPNFLRSRGIKRLDVVVITHPDRDHYGGLLELKNAVKIDHLIVPTHQGDKDYENVLRNLERTGTKILIAGADSELKGLGYKINFLWPDTTTLWFYSHRLIPTNPVSIVARIENQGLVMLFPGDCETPELFRAINQTPQVNLLKSSHHGSRKGNPPALFDSIQPEYVVVMGRHPTPAGLETILPTMGIHYINTRSAGGFVMKILPRGPVFSVRLPPVSSSTPGQPAGHPQEYRKKDKPHPPLD